MRKLSDKGESSFYYTLIDLNGSKKWQLNILASKKEIILKAIKEDNLESIANMPHGHRYIATLFSFTVCKNDSRSLRKNRILFCIFCLSWREDLTPFRKIYIYKLYIKVCLLNLSYLKKFIRTKSLIPGHVNWELINREATGLWT